MIAQHRPDSASRIIALTCPREPGGPPTDSRGLLADGLSEFASEAEASFPRPAPGKDGHGNILEGDARTIEERDFFRGTACEGTGNHAAQAGTQPIPADQSEAVGVLAFADGDRLFGIVDHDARRPHQFGVEFLLARGIGAHGIDMGAGPDPGALQ